MTDAPTEPATIPPAPRPASGAIVRYDGPRSIDELRSYAMLLATNGEVSNRRNEALPAVFRENPAALAYVVEYARALDIPPVTAIVGVHFIDGKMTASAGLISALIRRAGHRLVGPVISGTYEENNLRAVTRITRKDDPDTTYESVWTLQRAERAGLVKLKGDRYVAVKERSAWDTYPENMLKARSLTECGRDGAEDALMGMHYTPEELGAEVDGNGEIVYTVTQVQNWGSSDRPAEQQKPAENAAERPAISDAYIDELRQQIFGLANLDEAKQLWERVKASGLFDQSTWTTTPMADRDSVASTCQAVFNAEVARLKADQKPDDGQAAETPSNPENGPQGDNLGLPYEVVRLPNGEVDQVATLRNEVAWKKARQAEAGVPEPTGERPTAAERSVWESPTEQISKVMQDELTPQEVKALGIYCRANGLKLSRDTAEESNRDAVKMLAAVDLLLAWRPYNPDDYGNPAKDRRINPDGEMEVPNGMPTGEQAAAMGLDAEIVEETRNNVEQEHAATIAEQRHAETVEDREEQTRQFNQGVSKDAAKAAIREAARNAELKTQPASNPNPH